MIVWHLSLIHIFLMTAFAGCGKKEAATSGQGGKIEYKLAYHLPADHPLAKGEMCIRDRVKAGFDVGKIIAFGSARAVYMEKEIGRAHV